MRTLFILLSGIGLSTLWAEKATVSKAPAAKPTHHYAVLIRTGNDARQLQADINQYLNGQLADTYAGSYAGDSLVYTKFDAMPKRAMHNGHGFRKIRGDIRLLLQHLFVSESC